VHHTHTLVKISSAVNDQAVYDRQIDKQWCSVSCFQLIPGISAKLPPCQKVGKTQSIFSPLEEQFLLTNSPKSSFLAKQFSFTQITCSSQHNCCFRSIQQDNSTNVQCTHTHAHTLYEEFVLAVTLFRQLMSVKARPTACIHATAGSEELPNGTSA